MYIYKNENYENIDGALLGKPESQGKSCKKEVVKKIFKYDACTIRDQKPDAQKYE